MNTLTIIYKSQFFHKLPVKFWFTPRNRGWGSKIDKKLQFKITSKKSKKVLDFHSLYGIMLVSNDAINRVNYTEHKQ